MRVAVAIEKGTPWRGSEERFSNVYRYDFGVGGGIVPGAMDALVDYLVTKEKTVHNSDVTFRTARVWEVGGTPAENETLLLKDLSGTGSMVTGLKIWKEACVVVQWYTGRHTSTGRRIYLRKFIHPCAVTGTTAGQETGQVALASTTKTPFLTYGQDVRAFTLLAGAEAVTMEGPGGENNANDASVTVLDYLHVRQFKQ